MRKKTEILANALHIIDVAVEDRRFDETDPLREELAELIETEKVIEGVVADAADDDVPAFLITLARDITTIPPSGGEANRITVTRPAVILFRAEEQSRLKGLDLKTVREDLLPRDTGLRVVGNWRIVDVLSVDGEGS
jgi:hypothetical protein